MKDKHKPRWPMFGPEDLIGEGDSRIIHDCLDDIGPRDRFKLFETLKAEIDWQTMSHRSGEVPRLVCAQGTYQSDGSFPIYRHPADEVPKLLPWSPTVDAIRSRVQTLVSHEMNHCLVQLYRSGHDFISEHSDKTLDIAHGSSIVNVSLGAQRMMRLRTKRDARSASANGDATQVYERKTQLVQMPHGSMFILGLRSNAVWLHGINPDKRPDLERSEAESEFDGQRISLTFRNIATFLDAAQSKIWGQGATSKSQAHAKNVQRASEDEIEKLVIAFGTENHSSYFDWEQVYGAGFDVVNFCEKRQDD
ncbi:MAG: hypothetical protein Q9162_003910 [Coniocarpon cinnabarinum]